MCVSSSNRATRQAERAEQDRQRQVERGRTAVDQAMTGREAEYGQFVNALREHLLSDLTRQQSQAARQLRFGLARGGLTAGSFAGDAGTNLARESSLGQMGAERRVQGAEADLRGADENTRLNLYQLVQGGADATTAAQRAGAAMRSNLSGAMGANLSEGLGNVFGGTADLYRRQQEAAERRRGLRESQLYASPFTRGDG